MKMANAKRKKAMQMSDVEKQNYERLKKIPEDNQVIQRRSEYRTIQAWTTLEKNYCIAFFVTGPKMYQLY